MIQYVLAFGKDAETLPELLCNTALNWARGDELIQDLNENISTEFYILPLEHLHLPSLLFPVLLKHSQEVQ